MLKIKDDVDLKELEKFGFKPSNYDKDIYSYTIHEDNIVSTAILVNQRDFKDRRICFNVNIEDFELEIDYFDETYNIDVIFDLIQAGLVEKVEE